MGDEWKSEGWKNGGKVEFSGEGEEEQNSETSRSLDFMARIVD